MQLVDNIKYTIIATWGNKKNELSSTSVKLRWKITQLMVPREFEVNVGSYLLDKMKDILVASCRNKKK